MRANSIDALSLVPFAERLLRSPWWWRRAMALRALGAMQAADHTGAIVAALDDSNDDVRNTALDALADMQNPASLPAIVVRLHDASLHRARRGAALAAFGSKCEPFLLDLAAVDPEHRLNYALALGICGTAAARPILCEWSGDTRADVRAAAMEALSRIGVDRASVPFAIAALEDRDATVRAMAATALHGYADRDTAASLARHLDDTWAVAVQGGTLAPNHGGRGPGRARGARHPRRPPRAAGAANALGRKGVAMSLTTVLAVFTVVVTAYFVAYNVSQFAMAGVAGRFLWRYHRRRNPRNLALVARLAAPPFVSIVVPAHNEALTIVDSIRALLALEYEAREIVVVNDGSKDDTLAILTQAFELVEAPVAFEQPLKSAPLRGAYRSLVEPALVVIDKVNGGSKADAVNAGINAASGRLVLVIDADTMLEPDALTRAAMPFLEHPDTVAVGGYVAIANGCRIEHSRVTDVAMPRSWLARFQIVEYMRSFLLFRLACASGNGVALISGAFGLFRRDALIDVGGYDGTAIGEDMDLTLRLQAYYRERKRPIRIAHVPLPVCWTQAPEDWQSLRAQRCRWRRGLLQVLWRQRRMIGNPRYGIIGMGVLPYIAIFEGLGPLIELLGYVVTTMAFFLGLLNWQHYRVMLAASILFGAATTLVSVFLSDVSTRKYLRLRDLALLVASAILENAGYRQLNSWWGCVGTVQAMTGKGGWGPMKRKAF